MNYLFAAAAVVGAFVALIWVLAGIGAEEPTVDLDELLESS